jgi:diaminopimelate epimerase
MVACFLRASNLNLVSNNIKVYPKSEEQLNLRKEKDSIYFKGKVSCEYTKKIDA